MLVAAALCPHPPLLVPGVGGGAGWELEPLRAACLQAVRMVVVAEPDVIVVVGDAPATGPLDPVARADLRPYGVSLTFGGGPGPARLPLAHTIATWLLGAACYDGEREFVGIAAAETPSACAALGAALVAGDSRVGLLVMGDGSARRGPKAPGYYDPRSIPYDGQASAALLSGAAAAVLALDPHTGRELLVAGRASWQVLAGAAGAEQMDAELLAEEAPYGVAYLVATWLPASTRPPA